ncbi:MAG: 16S rRNA (guanine(966)-N(2))-methyltransferase RsmD [Bryobacterales bacterium]|nr:16S rRNA (guanine(966)-N(2))-methyltransferase RsmD [Bryobacterales bacterium]
MRVIGGEFRSRRLKPAPGYEVRPTPDRLRETLFDILAPRIEGATFVDAYAGTGAVGIEAVSRGAKAILIEKSRHALKILEENVASLGIEGRVKVLRGAARLLLPRWEGDIVFLDPPYGDQPEYEAVMRILGEMGRGLVVAQHHSKHVLAEEYGKLRRVRVVKQGDNALSFYEGS